MTHPCNTTRLWEIVTEKDRLNEDPIFGKYMVGREFYILAQDFNEAYTKATSLLEDDERIRAITYTEEVLLPEKS